jgi:ATP-dependent Clp protease ATP-binding subunit ClpB
LGAPRGFAGDKEGGYLTEAVRRKPFSLILVDEIEKAHPDILNLFLQIMEDGRLTDNMGRTVSFANTIIIMTSNAAADFVQSALLDGRTIENIRQTLINEKLKQYFRPEFINRLDGLIVFKPLDKVELVEVARLLVAKIAAKLSERGINLKVSDAALSEFAEHGYDPVFGARPLRRLMQEKIDNLLAKYLLGNKLDPRDKVVIDGIDNIKVEKREEI